MTVAEIMIDRLEDDVSASHVGKQFDYEAMCNWWGWHDLPDQDGWLPKAKTLFKLYDDDDELYYEGWLLNDDEGIVQQFVLDWAKADSGCTTILIRKSGQAGYIQEIG